MNRLDSTTWEILNATADDCENLEQIYRQVCVDYIGAEDAYRPRKGAPGLSEVASGVRRLVEAGLLAVVMDEGGRPWLDSDELSYVWRGWFRMTVQGEAVWEEGASLGQSVPEPPTADLFTLPGA